MKKYTKQQIIDMLKRNCHSDIGFVADEEDYNMLCDLLEIEESER